MPESKSCYACDKQATTREHVPPLCLFPEAKDIGNLNFRKDLITVPSCDDHNSKKSKDDEFLMISLAGIVGNNVLGFLHTRTKVNRALKRKSKGFLNGVIRNAKPKVVKFKEQKFPLLYGTPDFARLFSCFKSIAIGLYMHDFKSSFKGEIRVFLGFIDYRDPNDNVFADFIRKRFELEERAMEIKGQNPDVFTYQFCKPDELGLIAMKMTFYQGTDVFITYIPSGVTPPDNLSMKFIRDGIPTILNLKDQQFRFNL